MRRWVVGSLRYSEPIKLRAVLWRSCQRRVVHRASAIPLPRAATDGYVHIQGTVSYRITDTSARVRHDANLSRPPADRPPQIPRDGGSSEQKEKDGRSHGQSYATVLSDAVLTQNDLVVLHQKFIDSGTVLTGNSVAPVIVRLLLSEQYSYASRMLELYWTKLPRRIREEALHEVLSYSRPIARAATRSIEKFASILAQLLATSFRDGVFLSNLSTSHYIFSITKSKNFAFMKEDDILTIATAVEEYYGSAIGSISPRHVPLASFMLVNRLLGCTRESVDRQMHLYSLAQEAQDKSVTRRAYLHSLYESNCWRPDRLDALLRLLRNDRNFGKYLIHRAAFDGKLQSVVDAVDRSVNMSELELVSVLAGAINRLAFMSNIPISKVIHTLHEKLLKRFHGDRQQIPICWVTAAITGLTKSLRPEEIVDVYENYALMRENELKQQHLESILVECCKAGKLELSDRVYDVLTQLRGKRKPLPDSVRVQYARALVHFGLSSRYRFSMGTLVSRLREISADKLRLTPSVLSSVIESLAGSSLSLVECQEVILVLSKSFVDTSALGGNGGNTAAASSERSLDSVYRHIVQLGAIKKPNKPWLFMRLLRELRQRGAKFPQSVISDEALRCIRILSSPTEPNDVGGQLQRAWMHCTTSPDKMIKSFNASWSRCHWN